MKIVDPKKLVLGVAFQPGMKGFRGAVAQAGEVCDAVSFKKANNEGRPSR